MSKIAKDAFYKDIFVGDIVIHSSSNLLYNFCIVTDIIGQKVKLKLLRTNEYYYSDKMIEQNPTRRKRDVVTYANSVAKIKCTEESICDNN